MIRSAWGWPAILAVVTLAGLISALAGDGLADQVSWIALALPIAAFARAWTRRRRR